MVLHADIVSRLDERAADRAADQLVDRFGRAGVVAGREFRTGLEQSMSGTNLTSFTNSFAGQVAPEFTQHGRRAARGFGSGFGSELASALPVVGGFTSAMAGYESTAGKAGAAAGRALGLAFTTAAAGLIGAAGYTLFKGFERYEAIDAAKNRLDNLNRTLEGTGRAGIDVGAVMETVNQTVKDTPFALDQAFSVATRALASNTRDLKRFMTDVADSAGFAGAGIDEIGEAFLKISNTGKVSMEEIGNELRNIPILPWLQETLGVGGAELQKMISDGKVGLDDLLTTVEEHAGGFAKAAGETVSGALENVGTAVSRLGANFIGAIFGQPAKDASDLVTVLGTLQERIDRVGAWVTAHQDDIQRLFREGGEAVGDLIQLLGQVVGALDQIPGGISTVLEAFVAWKALTIGAGALASVNTMLGTTLPASAGKGAAGISAALSRVAVPAWLAYLVASNGPEIEQGIANAIPGGNTFNNLPTPADAGKATRDWWDRTIQGERGPAPGPAPLPQMGGGSGPATVGGIPIPGLVNPSTPAPAAPFGNLPGQTPFPVSPADRRGTAGSGGGTATGGPGPAGNPILAPPGAGGSSGSGPKLPPAPEVPYDTALPAGYAGLPQTAAIVSAENSWTDARHTLAEKQARLNQLENDNNATADDITKAKNDVINAQQGQQQAELRLQEARQSLFDKQNKQLTSQTSDLGELGAKIDSDFGISKGLAGIAENITKFVANLAAAPLLGQLNAISAASPSQGGFGAIGIAGAQGAFGPQFTGLAGTGTAGYSASALGPAALQPSGAVPGLPKPGESARDFAHRVMMPYWQSQGLTVGDHAADWAGEHQNGALDIMVDSLAEGQQVLQQVLSDPNTYGAIFNNQTYGYGHGMTPRDYSAGHTGNPTQDHQDHVHAWYKPGGANNIAPSTGGGYSMSPVGTPASTVPGEAAGTPTWSGPLGVPAYSGQGPGFLPSAGAGTALGNNPQLVGAPGIGGALGGGPRANATQIGGVGGLQGTGKGGGPGMTQGGMVDTALSAATTGLDMLAPGAGQAAQVGIKLANRAIQFGGQAVGIGVQGALDTFLPFGGSKLAQSNWLTRIVGGVAGAAPALPNMAGKSSQPTPQQAANVDPNTTQHGQGGGQPPGGNTYTANITNNQPRDEAGAGRDALAMWQNQGPGM